MKFFKIDTGPACYEIDSGKYAQSKTAWFMVHSGDKTILLELEIYNRLDSLSENNKGAGAWFCPEVQYSMKVCD